MTDQISLLPAKQVRFKHARMKVRDLRRLNPKLGPEPTDAMIASVTAAGIIQPLILLLDAKGKPRIKAGLRRLRAAERAGLESVPCLVAQDEGSLGYVISLIENTQRSANPLAELRAIERLTCNGASLDDICRDTGLPRARAEKRLRLKALLPELYQAVLKGKIRVSVAEQIAKLPAEYQLILLDRFRAGEPLTSASLADVKSVRQARAAAELPREIFAPPPSRARQFAEQLIDMHQSLAKLEEAVDSHEHNEFETCDACRSLPQKRSEYQKLAADIAIVLAQEITGRSA